MVKTGLRWHVQEHGSCQPVIVSLQPSPCSWTGFSFCTLPFQSLANSFNKKFLFHRTTLDFFVVLILAKEIYSRLSPQLSTTATAKVKRMKQSEDCVTTCYVSVKADSHLNMVCTYTCTPKSKGKTGASRRALNRLWDGGVRQDIQNSTCASVKMQLPLGSERKQRRMHT